MWTDVVRDHDLGLEISLNRISGLGLGLFFCLDSTDDCAIKINMSHWSVVTYSLTYFATLIDTQQWI